MKWQFAENSKWLFRLIRQVITGKCCRKALNLMQINVKWYILEKKIYKFLFYFLIFLTVCWMHCWLLKPWVYNIDPWKDGKTLSSSQMSKLDCEAYMTSYVNYSSEQYWTTVCSILITVGTLTNSYQNKIKRTQKDSEKGYTLPHKKNFNNPEPIGLKEWQTKCGEEYNIYKFIMVTEKAKWNQLFTSVGKLGVIRWKQTRQV